jgi:hypothetical protein
VAEEEPKNKADKGKPSTGRPVQVQTADDDETANQGPTADVLMISLHYNSARVVRPRPDVNRHLVLR